MERIFDGRVRYGGGASTPPPRAAATAASASVHAA